MGQLAKWNWVTHRKTIATSLKIQSNGIKLNKLDSKNVALCIIINVFLNLAINIKIYIKLPGTP